MRERIEMDPNVHFGKPCVAGTRIPVQSVLVSHTEEELMTAFTGIEPGRHPFRKLG